MLAMAVLSMPIAIGSSLGMRRVAETSKSEPGPADAQPARTLPGLRARARQAAAAIATTWSRPRPGPQRSRNHSPSALDVDAYPNRHRALAWRSKQISRSIRGRALERDDLIPGAALRLERNGPTLVQVRCVVADRKRISVQNIDALPGLPL
jgi:hypothetical protein